MKLLYLTNVQIPAENAQNLQIQAMSKAFFYSLKEDFLLVSPWNEKNEKMTPIYHWKKIKISQWLPRFLRQALLLIKSKKIVSNFQPDVIYTRDIAIAWFFRRIGFKTVYEIHKPFTTMIGNMIFKLVSKKISARGRPALGGKIVAISQSLKDFIVEEYNINSDNILVAHDGVDMEEFNFLESKEELREKYFKEMKDRFIVLYSGSQEKGKGVEMIIDAASELKNLIFVVIGSQKDEQRDNLIFRKRMEQEEIPKYLRMADLLVLPMNKSLSYSHFSSPLKLFEYMASQSPILASNIGAIGEILDEHNSFLFDPDKKGDFEEKILHVRNNMLEAQTKAKKALEDVEKYTWEKRAENILNFLK